MYAKKVTYTDYNGVERTEEFYFNLTKAELTMMNLSEVGGLKAKMEKMIEKQDAPLIMATFEDILTRSYGEKSADGRRFIKSPEITEGFKQTEAYSEIFMELCTDPDAASEFMAGIIPPDLNKDLQAMIDKQGGAIALVK